MARRRKKRLVTEETNRQLQQQITDFERNYQQQIAAAFQQHEHQKQEWQTQQVQLQQSYDAKILELEEQLKKTRTILPRYCRNAKITKPTIRVTGDRLKY